MVGPTLKEVKELGYTIVENKDGTVTAKTKPSSYTKRQDKRGEIREEYTAREYTYKDGQLISGAEREIRVKAQLKRSYAEEPYTKYKYYTEGEQLIKESYELVPTKKGNVENVKLLEREKFQAGQSVERRQEQNLTPTQKERKLKIAKAEAKKQTLSSTDKLLLAKKQEMRTPTKQEDFIKSIYEKRGQVAYIDAGGNLIVTPKGAKVHKGFIGNITNPQPKPVQNTFKMTIQDEPIVDSSYKISSKATRGPELQAKINKRLDDLSTEYKESKVFLDTTGKNRFTYQAMLTGAGYVGVKALGGFTYPIRHPLKTVGSAYTLVRHPIQSVKAIVTSFGQEPIGSTAQTLGTVGFFKTAGVVIKGAKVLNTKINEAYFRRDLGVNKQYQPVKNVGPEYISNSQIYEYAKTETGNLVLKSKYQQGLPVIDKTGAVLKETQRQIYNKDVDVLAKPRNTQGSIKNPYAKPQGTQYEVIDYAPKDYQNLALTRFYETHRPSVTIKSPTPKSEFQYTLKDYSVDKPTAVLEAEAIASRIPRNILLDKRASIGGQSFKPTYQDYTNIWGDTTTLKAPGGTTTTTVTPPSSTITAGPDFLQINTPYAFAGVLPFIKTETTKTGLKYNVVTEQIEDSKVENLPALIDKSAVKSDTAQAKKVVQAQAVGVASDTIVKSSTAQKQEIISQQVSEEILDEVTESTFNRPPKRTTRKKPPKIEKPFIPKSPFLPRGQEEPFIFKPTYTLLVRRRGLFSPIATTETPEEAILRGKFYTDTTAGASFKVASSGSNFDIEDIASRLLPENKYRASKKEEGVFIERRKFRIDTPGEKRDITFLGIGKQKLKRGKKQNGIFL